MRNCGETLFFWAWRALASHADVLTGSSRNLSSPVRGVGTRDEPLRTFAWEARRAPGVRLLSCAKPILRKKPTVLQSTCSAVVFLFKKTLFFSHCHRHCVIIPFGRFPFIPKFRKFRLEIKWNRPFRFDPTGMFGTTFEGGLP